MKNTVKFIGIAFVLLTLSVNVMAQSVSATATAEAWIVTPLDIQKVHDLSFGNVAVNTVDGTVLLSPAGIRSAGPGGAMPVANPTGPVSAAEFEVSGTVGQLVTLTLPSTDCIVTNGANTMPVNTFICDQPASFPIPSGGLITLKVGATLNVTGGQAPGHYITATADKFTVTVVYQ